MLNPAMHFEILADDPAQIRNFYGTLFGWQASDCPGMDHATPSGSEDNS